MSHRVTLLWYDGCPGLVPAREVVARVVGRVAPDAVIDDIAIEPGFIDPGDHAPGCRLYRTKAGFAGLADPRWLEEALRA